MRAIIGEGGGWPDAGYGSFVGTSQALAATYSQVESPILLPSPLLSGSSPFVLCYFQYDSNGNLTSPQVPREEVNEVIRENIDLTERQLTAASRQLAALSEFTDRDTLLDLLPAPNGKQIPTATALPGQLAAKEQQQKFLPNGFLNPNTTAKANPPVQQIEIDNNVNRRGSFVVQQQMAANEYRLRARNSAQVANTLLSTWKMYISRPDVRAALWKPVCVG